MNCAFEQWRSEHPGNDIPAGVGITYEYAKEALPEAIGRAIGGDVFQSYSVRENGEESWYH